MSATPADGTTLLVGDVEGLAVGEVVEAVAVSHDGVDLVARPTDTEPTR